MAGFSYASKMTAAAAPWVDGYPQPGEIVLNGFHLRTRAFPQHVRKYNARMSDEDDFRDLQDTEMKYVPVSIQQLARAVTQVDSCEKCNPEAEIPFDWVLRAIADAKDYFDYILPAPGLCPKCRAEIYEKTLVQPIGNPDAANWM
jgi:hypothetical protein